jgi:hypothetical protein
MTTNLLTWHEMDDLLLYAKVLHTGAIRYGQALMSGLFLLRPELYYKIAHTEADCFYDDNKVDRFMVAVSGPMNN